MKWSEVEGLSEGALLAHLGSGRKAVLLGKYEIPRMIGVRYLGSRLTERVKPSEFTISAPPNGTVSRTK